MESSHVPRRLFGIVAFAFAFSLVISFVNAISVSHTNQHDWHHELEPDTKSSAGSSSDESFASSSISFPMIYKWSKRNPKSEKGCSDPTEPFQCPGSNICISLQFLCDGHANDCPNNYDEDQALCVSGIDKK